MAAAAVVRSKLGSSGGVFSEGTPFGADSWLELSEDSSESTVSGGRFDASSEFRTPSRIGGEGREDGVVSGSHSSTPNYRPDLI